jgi:hypothetical protein
MVSAWKKIVLLLVLGTGIMVLTPPTLALDDLNDTIPSDDTQFAGSFDIGPTEGDIILTITPENPGPFTTISARITSSYIDLNRYPTRWIVDGATIQNAIGVRQAIFKTKDYGQTTTITVIVTLPDQTIQKQVVLKPEDATLLWEAIDAYVPPFYQGKKLVPREGVVKIVSIPNFAGSAQDSFDPATGVYTWKRNGLVIPGVNGYGKQSYLFTHNRIRSSETIQVTASDTGHNHQAIQSVTITPIDPKIVFYRRNTTSGIKDPLAQQTITFDTDELALETAPYFFSTLNNNPNTPTFSWMMNNASITVPNAKTWSRLTLKKPEGAGSATIGVTVHQPSKLFQTVTASIPIIFKD